MDGKGRKSETMQLNEKTIMGEEQYECDRCRIRGERKLFVIEESGRNFCLSCWLEKEHNRLISSPVSSGF